MATAPLEPPEDAREAGATTAVARAA